jgi:hypothetical protein
VPPSTLTYVSRSLSFLPRARRLLSTTVAHARVFSARSGTAQGLFRDLSCNGSIPVSTSSDGFTRGRRRRGGGGGPDGGGTPAHGLSPVHPDPVGRLVQAGDRPGGRRGALRVVGRARSADCRRSTQRTTGQNGVMQLGGSYLPGTSAGASAPCGAVRERYSPRDPGGRGA